MSFYLKLALCIAGLLALILGPYFLWHEPMDAYFASADYQNWLASVRSYAWLVGIGLLVADLFLPVPAGPVMATLGTIYGTVLGGIIGAVGSILAGLIAYGLARWVGRRAARLLASEQDLADFQRFFDTWGGGGIIATRVLPVVPEVLTFLAGLARMHFGRFCLALVLGALPTSFLLAWVGQAAGTSSSLLLVLTLIPLALWCVYLVWRRRCGSTSVEPAAQAPESP